jgi:Spy/CpxP family protein refolding chaperone
MNQQTKFDSFKLSALSIGLGSLLFLAGCNNTTTTTPTTSPGSGTTATSPAPGGGDVKPPAGGGAGADPTTVGLEKSNRDGADPIQLIQSDQVKKELGLTDEQITKIKEMEGSLRQEIAAKEAALQLKGLDPKQKEEKLKSAAKDIDDLTKKSRAKAGEILKPEQIKRIKEIMLQVYGWSVLTRNDYKDDLKLTAEQDKQLDTIQEQMSSQMRSGWTVPTGDKAEETLSANRRKMDAIMKASNAQALKVLTPEQTAKLETLKGAKFTYTPPKPDK